MKRVYASMLLQEYYYVMITSALRLLKISRVRCPTKLPGPFSNTSAVRATIQVQDMKLFGKLFPTPSKLSYIFPDF